MLDPFLGEIAWVAFDFAPDGWLVCDGRTLPCSQYSALYALLGNRYGPSAGYTLANAADPSGGTPALYAAPGAGASVALGGVAATVTSNVGGAVTVANNGGSQPFSLMQPYLPLLPIIAYVGIFPTKS